VNAVRSRIVIASLVAIVAIGAGVLLWPKGSNEKVAAAQPSTTVTTAAPTTAPPKPTHPFEAADAVVGEVNLYDAPGATEPTGSLPNPTVEHVPLAFLVKQHGPPGWLQVQIPRRPNGSLAWIHAEDVGLRGVDNRIVVEVGARQLTLYKGTTNEVLLQAPVAVGTSATPTPLGDFYVDIIVRITQSGGVYGPYQLSVAGFSDVLQTFGGGPGQIAIHGTNRPDLIGQDVSNGCVRMSNDNIVALQPMAPVGTPVQIVP
jgi:hypothetical protein